LTEYAQILLFIIKNPFFSVKDIQISRDVVKLQCNISSEVKMNRFIYKSAGDVSRRPKKPTISRFVSPWDTSGWYSVLPDFGVGKAVYSNTDAVVLSCDEKYFGADYIMTFNSAAEGFDDKQEVDFFVESDSVVSVFLDAGVPAPSWADDFKNTGDTAILSNGAKYVAFEKTFSDGAEVHIPGINGDGNHFFVLVRPVKNEETEMLAAVPPFTCTLGEYAKKTYKSYVSEPFNFDGALDNFDISPSVTLETRDGDARDKYAKIEGVGRIEKKFENVGDKLVASALVEPISPDGIYAVCAMVDEAGENIVGVFIDGGEIKAVTKSAVEKLADVNYGARYSVKTVYDKTCGMCEVWLNSRVAASDLPSNGDVAEVGFYSNGGEVHIDNFKVYDDTEVFVFDEDGSTLGKDKFIISENAVMKSVPLPFEGRPSLSLSSADTCDATAVYEMQRLSGAATVETKIRASDRGMARVSLMTESGECAAVALYMNNLYVSDGDEWRQVYAGLVDWFYYPCDNYFFLKITFDINSNTFDVWVDGACRAKGFKMRSCGAVCGLGYTVGKKTELLIEKMRAYDAADLCRGVIPSSPVFDVRSYGAVGDGKTLDTAAIQHALDDAAYTGGTVLIRGGTFLSGELMLRSDETVFVAPDATILGTQDHSFYPLREPRTSLCAHRQLGRGLLYGENISNITVTGGGMLDGNGLYRFKMNDPVNDKRELDARPDIIYIAYSDNITVENINFKSSAFWTVVPLSSGNITLKNLYLDCMNTPNRDGIDPVDCHDITVSGCAIMAGDDGLCFKSSDPVGTDTYYSLEHARFTDCTVKNVNRCGVSLETVDGAFVGDVVFERVDMTDVGAPVYITVGARNRLPRGIDTARKSRIDGVLFKDIRFENAYPFSYTKDIREVIACGQSDSQRLDNVTFENCFFELGGGFDFVPDAPNPIDARYPEYDRHGLSAGHAFTVRYAKNFTVKDCKIVLEKPDVRPMIAEFDTENDRKC